MLDISSNDYMTLVAIARLDTRFMKAESRQNELLKNMAVTAKPLGEALIKAKLGEYLDQQELSQWGALLNDVLRLGGSNIRVRA